MTSTTTPPRITVVGTGYLGATHAVCMAKLGIEVLGVDVDDRKIAELAAGRVPFYEPGLAEELSTALESGRLRFTTDFDEAARFGDVHFVCVGTPQEQGSDAADLRYVDSAMTELASRIHKHALIVGKSTVPVGTAARLAQLVTEVAPQDAEVELAWNPEFLREGFAVDDTLHPDRLVFGVESEWAEHLLEDVFRPIIDAETPVIVADLATAELVKVAANSFLATKISYINAMAEVCEAAGADVDVLATALSHDGRIGGRFLKPGLGFGGGCLPKDIRAFRHRAAQLGVGQAVAFLEEVDAINQRRRSRTVELVRELAGEICAGCAWRLSAPRSSPTPTTCATRRRSTSRGCSTSRARRSRCTTPRPTRTRTAPTPTSSTSIRSARRRTRPRSSCCSPSGTSSGTPTRPSSATSWRSGGWSTPGTRSMPRPTGRRAGSTGPSVSRPWHPCTR
ncbi:hypothetical protein GCM10025869_08300 [Homoserinibacter gongjuensis]|uniref:UDP-glucose 6-dehydrogenase n=1 Tax=Homoserinibacter gongjuensis TaxID=1162968 RepID=A0ABQ6JS36_9MICO|nr:hypothetical protein GCM10025869_08300 [Homoserinibacter gongjuensis]